jgi:hypothetical protein
MKNLRAIPAAALAVLAVLSFASCGGGRVAYVPQAVVSQQSRAASAGDATGRVIDAVTGRGVAGAVVVVSPQAYPGGQPPPVKSGAPRSTTDVHGYFHVRELLQNKMSSWSWKYVDQSIPDLPYPEWVEVFPPKGVARAVYHGFQTVRYGKSNALGTVSLLEPTVIEIQWARGVGHDRRHLGTPPSRQTLVFDDVTLAAGRRWAAYMAANEWFSHGCPAPHTGYPPCQQTWLWEIANHGMPSAENIAYGGPLWRAAEASFMAERTNCPHGGNWKTCPYSETTGHYINIMAASHWLGLGEAAASDGSVYWDMEFTGPALYTSSLRK